MLAIWLMKGEFKAMPHEHMLLGLITDEAAINRSFKLIAPVRD